MNYLTGLGKTAATPIRDILNYFLAEVEAHIKLKVCPAGVCPMTGKRVIIRQNHGANWYDKFNN